MFYFAFQSTLIMENEKYINDIAEIKEMMHKSSRFISLSGLSGILAGIYALIGASIAYTLLYKSVSITSDYKNLIISEDTSIKIVALSAIVLVLSIATGFILSVNKAKKRHENLWNSTSKRMVINFLIPLATGGFFILVLIEKDFMSLVAPSTLLFYGLACVNASKYTLGDIRYLGITMILIGLVSTWFLGYGLVFWALGFGVCHIIYGSLMYSKYDRK
jgi:hypothetical protein